MSFHGKIATGEWDVYFERRRRKLEKRRIVSRDKRRSRNRRKNQENRKLQNERTTERGEVLVEIGKTLDPMIHGTGTIEACKKINDYVRIGKKRVYVDLGSLQKFSLAGVILLSTSVKKSGESIFQKLSGVRGNLPDDENVASNFLASGFFDNFKQEGLHLPPPRARWTSARERRVVTEKAAVLVDFAESQVPMERAQRNAIWQNLVECMTNTHNHAKGVEAARNLDNHIRNRKNQEEWIAGVMCDNGIAHFAFVDQGVGICASVGAQSRLRRLGQTLMGYGPQNIVKEAFEGKLESSTKSKGRGLGLPRMTRDAKRNLLEDLHVRTGKVKGNIRDMDFCKLSENLQGTILTWIARGNREAVQ